MASEHHHYPTSEKLLILVQYCIGRYGVSVKEVAELFGCHQKTAKRMMVRLSGMSHELSFLDATLVDGLLAVKLKP